MKYLAAIPCVNRLDLLRDAIDSVRAFWDHLLLIDNTVSNDLSQDLFGKAFPILKPTVPLTFCQTMNAITNIAVERSCDFYLVMHNDALAGGGTPEQFLEFIQHLFTTERKWGVVFTNYDTLCAFNTAAVLDVGQWDTVFHQYFADNDYYRRMRIKRYETVDSGLPVLHRNNGSNTIKSDTLLGHINHRTFDLYKAYYVSKWGGEPGGERYTVPFNRTSS